MRILAISDLHLDVNKKVRNDIESYVFNMVDTNDIDCLIVAGDVAANLQILSEFLNKFSDLNIHKMYVPGNHDLWVNHEQLMTSDMKYYEILPEICKRFSWQYLPANPQIIDNVGFVGSIGWYDYSLRNRTLDNLITTTDYQRKINSQHKMWMDTKYIRWSKDMTDHQVTTKFNTELLKDLHTIGFRRKLKMDTHGYQSTLEHDNLQHLVAVTHMVPDVELLYRTNNPEIDYFHAFLGSATIGQLFDSINNTQVSNIAGHYHRKAEFSKSSRNIYLTPLGYTHEWARYHSDLNLAEMIEYKSKIIELQ